MSNRLADPTLRSLDASETLFWLYNQTTPFHFVIAGQFAGRTDIADWRRALDVVQRANPMLGCGIEVLADGRAAFVEIDDSIPMRVVQGRGEEAWQPLFADELFEPIAMQGCLVRAALVHAPHRSVLILAFHHAVADGISAAHLFEEILTALSDRDLIARAQAPQRQGNDQVRSGQRPGLSAPPSAHQRMAARPIVQCGTLSRPETEAVLGASRRNGATLHGTLAAALIQCGREVSPGWQVGTVRLLSPINTRPLLGLSNDPRLAVAMAMMGVEPQGDLDFWGIARAVTGDVAHKRSAGSMNLVSAGLDGFIASHPGPEEVQRFMVDTFTSEMMLSNLGSLPLAINAGGLTLQAIWGPGVMTGVDGEQVIGAATLSGELHLLHSSYSPLPRLLTEAIQVLRGLG